MSLIKQLKAKKEAAAQNIPKEKWDIMINSTQKLLKRKLSSQALQEGDQMVDFELLDAIGNTVSLSQLLEKGKVVISFYRGGWCPYCNMELRALQEILSEIKDIKASLVAISPETPDNSLTTSEKNELKFTVLSDIDNHVARKIGLIFQMPEDLREVYHSFNLDVPKHNGNFDYELPMPATYVVDKDRTIIYAFVSEDYTERANPSEILKMLHA